MRILMLDNEFPPLGGGTGVVNYYLLREFSVIEDVWVDLVTSSRTRDRFELEQFADRIVIYKVPVNNRNIHHSSNRELLSYAWRGLFFCYQLLRKQRYDLSFAFAGVPAGVMSYVLKMIYGLPFLVSLQGPDVPGFEARYNYLYPFLKPLLRQVWSQASVVTAISREHRALAHKTIPQLDIPIIPNGVDIDAFSPSVRSRSCTLPVNIVCVGRLIERKGQHHLVRAFAALCARGNNPPVTLTLVGTGDAEAALQRLVTDLGLADKVCFTGFVSREDMPAIYRQADIFVLPSQNEGMSIALLEAMASGLPVVVSDTGGTAELVSDGENGYVVPWADVPALTDVLARLVRDVELRQRMGDLNRQIAGRFSWSAMARAYLDLCARIARGTRR